MAIICSYQSCKGHFEDEQKNFFGVAINKTFFWLKKNAQFFCHFPTYMKIYNHGNFGQDSSFRLATFNFKNWSNMLFGQWANLFNLLCGKCISLPEKGSSLMKSLRCEILGPLRLFKSHILPELLRLPTSTGGKVIKNRPPTKLFPQCKISQCYNIVKIVS